MPATAGLRSKRKKTSSDNYALKRTSITSAAALKEKEEFGKYASLKLIEQLLPVVDNFDRALAAAKRRGISIALSKAWI